MSEQTKNVVRLTTEINLTQDRKLKQLCSTLDISQKDLIGLIIDVVKAEALKPAVDAFNARAKAVADQEQRARELLKKMSPEQLQAFILANGKL